MILEGFALGLLFFWSIGTLRRGAPFPAAAIKARTVLWLLGCWWMFIVVQMIPLPEEGVRIASPGSANIYDIAFGRLKWNWRSISIDAGTTLIELQKYIAYGAIYFLTLVTVTTTRRLWILACVMFGIGVFQATVGLYLHVYEMKLFPFDYIIGRQTDYPVQGTFANRNHFAENLAMASACGLGLLYAAYGKHWNSMGKRSIFFRLISSMLEVRLLVVVPLIFVVGTMLLSESRAAVLAFLGSLILSSIVAVSISRERSNAPKLMVIFLVIVLSAGSWAGVTGLLSRMTPEQFRNEERIQQWKNTIPLVKDFIYTGAGAGNYNNSFPMYREGTLRAVNYDHAHNDYLEILVDQGLMGSFLVGLAVLNGLMIIVNAYKQRRDPFMKGMLFASMLGSSAFLLHGLVDYNYHIPANAAWFFVLLAIGTVAAVLPRNSTSRSRGESSNSTLSRF